MERFLITQSLISSWGYALTCVEECRETAYVDFLNTLNRIPTPPTPLMQNGIAFEKEVYREAGGVARTPHPEWENGIKAVAGILRSAPVQVKAHREMTVGGMDLLVYGILDALKAGTIYDVKFSNQKFHTAELAGKFLDSAQHPAYFYLVPEANEFIYLVSDGDDLYTERYTRRETRPFAEIAAEFLGFLDEAGLMKTYREKWAAL